MESSKLPPGSPLLGYTEIECYQHAKRILKILGNTPSKRMTARRLCTHVKVDRKHHLTEGQVVAIARQNNKTFAVEPYGQTTRIYIRPLKGVNSGSTNAQSTGQSSS